MIRSLGYDPWRAHAIPPTLCSPIKCWLLKVSKRLQRGAIFQHKAVLSYLTFTYSCHVLPSCLQVAFKMAQDRNLGPTWPHLGRLLVPKRLPRGAQEAPRSSILIVKISILCRRGSLVASYPVACNMSPLGSRRGPALRASIRRRTPAVSDHARTY